MVGPPKKKEDENTWRTIIEDTPLNDDKWNVKVIILESAGSEHDLIYLNKFEVFALQERRFVIKNISKTETIFMINQLGAEKKVKDPNLRVFEEGQSYLKEHKVIPPDVLALIIKYLILKMKNEYVFIKDQRLEVQLGIHDEMDIMFDKPEVRNLTITKSAKIVEVDSPQPSSKNKAAANEIVNPVPQNDKKYDTYLRVRGEEWRDKVYVDDFPTDGPNIYVAVTGFAESQLAGCLVNIGVPLTAVVQIRIDPTETKVPSLLTRMTKRGQNPTESNQVEKIQQFWEEIQQIRIQKETSETLKDTAFFIFTPPYWGSEDLSGEDEKIYDEICYLLYDIQDLYRQHFHYLDNMEVTDVPSEIANDRYRSHYQQLFCYIPYECNTIYLIVDSILQTVCNDWDSEKISSNTVFETENLPNKDPIDEHVEKTKNIMDQVFNMLCKTDLQNKTYRSTYGEEYESLNDPIIIKYGNDARVQTFHLENLNVEKTVWSSLYCMPTNLLWQNQSRPVIEIEAKINFHVNVLLSCFKRKDVETAELNRLIHILAFRKLYNNRSSIKQKHALPSTLKEFKKNYLKRSILAEPIPVFSSVLHFPSAVSSFLSVTKSENVSSESSSNQENIKINLLFMCPDLMELVSASEIATNKPQDNIIDDFEYFEDLSDIHCFQTILKAFNSYNCVDYKYCDVTDSLLMMFHNSYNQDRISYREWRSHLPTPLCLQDFFDFVFEENYEWIRNEEMLYDAEVNLNTKPDSKNIVNVSPVDCCLQNSYALGPEFLIEGSLKHADLVKAEDSMEDNASKQSNASFADTINTKSTQKTKTTISQKNTKNVAPSSVYSELSEILIRKPFLGYNLSDRRVEAFGKDSTYFSKDGTIVNCSYTFIIPMNIEYLSLCVVPGNRNIEFWFHNAFGKFITQETKNKCDSFRITNGDQVMINISKRTFSKKKSVEDLVLNEEPTQNDFTNLSQYYFDFVMTWPNGLITESVFENNSSRISHIKQFYSTPLSNLEEEMRCISMNGEVIVFKYNGFVEVLRPNGSYITIKKCHKKTINPSVIGQELDKDSSTLKRAKDKNKQLNSTKLSKQNLEEREKSDIKVVEYELNVKEFELIESNGVRELWIENNRFFLEKLLIRTTTDYNTGEIFSRRMDDTHTLLNKDGIYVVSFPDKTRIVTKYVVEDFEIYPEWTEEEIEYFELISNGRSNTEKNESQSASNMNVSNVIDEHLETNPEERFDGYVSIQLIYIIEHINLTTVTIDKASDKITIESPNETAITIDGNNRYEFHVDSATNATFDGTDFVVNYGACKDCKSETTCTIKVNSLDTTRFDHHWLKMKDSVDKKIVVNGEGIISILNDISNEDILANNDEDKVDDIITSEKKSESSSSTPDKCIETYRAKEIRFFVLKRDLSCSELIHRDLVESYKKDCRWQPWCSITQHDSFGDHRILHSILTPIHVNETEKWLMRSKFTVKPAHLTYKDLKKECGKGFYHWMRPYGRFKPKPITVPDILPPRTPPAFILRTLEQQWRDKDRENFKGARELIAAVLKYRKIMEDDSETSLNIPIIDTRSDDEKNTDDLIQALGERIYKNLKNKVEEDVFSRVKADITTKPPHSVDSGTVEAEREMSVDEMSDKASLLDVAEAAEVMSPNLKAYWRRRAEELKEEHYYLYLLRNPSIPPYFLNVLGGAIWWEMNNLTDEAVTKSERMKMMCLCLDENSSTSPTKETEELG